jgi:hypothetical protein
LRATLISQKIGYLFLTKKVVPVGNEAGLLPCVLHHCCAADPVINSVPSTLLPSFLSKVHTFHPTAGLV